MEIGRNIKPNSKNLKRKGWPNEIIISCGWSFIHWTCDFGIYGSVGDGSGAIAENGGYQILLR